jgi:hypothetical protein
MVQASSHDYLTTRKTLWENLVAPLTQYILPCHLPTAGCRTRPANNIPQAGVELELTGDFRITILLQYHYNTITVQRDHRGDGSS